MPGAASVSSGFGGHVLTRLAFDRLVNQVYKTLLFHAVGAVGASNADDRVINALCLAWQLVNRFNACGQYQTQEFCNWVIPILKFECATFLRIEHSHDDTTLPAQALFVLCGGDGGELPDDFWEAQRTEIVERLARLTLTPRQRYCTLAWVNGYTLVEIGAALVPEIGPRAVRKIIAGVEADYKAMESPEENRLFGPSVANLPAALWYDAPSASWLHKPYRPDRHARTRERL